MEAPKKNSYWVNEYLVQMSVKTNKQKPQATVVVLSLSLCYYFFKDFYLFIFREKGREGEREGEKH